VTSPSFPDKILIRGLKIRCILGVAEEERKAPQEICLDLEIFTDFQRPARSDRIEDALDYETLCRRVTEHVEGTSFHLLEALAEVVADLILQNEAVQAVTVKIFKPKILKNADAVGVEIHRKRR